MLCSLKNSKFSQWMVNYILFKRNKGCLKEVEEFPLKNKLIPAQVLRPKKNLPSVTKNRQILFPRFTCMACHFEDALNLSDTDMKNCCYTCREGEKVLWPLFNNQKIDCTVVTFYHCPVVATRRRMTLPCIDFSFLCSYYS